MQSFTAEWLAMDRNPLIAANRAAVQREARGLLDRVFAPEHGAAALPHAPDSIDDSAVWSGSYESHEV